MKLSNEIKYLSHKVADELTKPKSNLDAKVHELYVETAKVFLRDLDASLKKYGIILDKDATISVSPYTSTDYLRVWVYATVPEDMNDYDIRDTCPKDWINYIGRHGPDRKTLYGRDISRVSTTINFKFKR